MASPPELALAEELIEALQKARYIGISALVMVIWDYSELTSYRLDLMTPNISFFRSSDII